MIELDTARLIEILAFIEPVFSRAANDHIHSCVIFTPEAYPTLSISAVSYSTSVSFTMNATKAQQATRKGVSFTQFSEFAVSGKAMLGIISKMTSKTISLKNLAQGWVELSAKTSMHELPTMEGVRPPRAQQCATSTATVEVNRLKLIEALLGGSKAPTRDETRGIMAGVSLEILSVKCMMVIDCHSLDGSRLVSYVIETTDNHKEEPMFMAFGKTQCMAIVEMIKQTNDIYIKMSRDKSRVYISAGGCNLVATPIEGVKISAVANILALPCSISFDVNRELLRDSLLRISRVQDDEYGRVMLSLMGASLIVSKIDSSKGKARELLIVSGNSNNNQIDMAFNSSFLMAAISSFDKCDKIKISLSDRNGEVSSILITSEGNKSMKWVVVPVRLSGTRAA